MTNDTDLILQRMDTLEGNMREHLESCRALCTVKIQNVETIANKAHNRLDKHKDSIECLTSWKNRNLGAFGVITIILLLLGFKLQIIPT